MARNRSVSHTAGLDPEIEHLPARDSPATSQVVSRIAHLNQSSGARLFRHLFQRSSSEPNIKAINGSQRSQLHVSIAGYLAVLHGIVHEETLV